MADIPEHEMRILRYRSGKWLGKKPDKKMWEELREEIARKTGKRKLPLGTLRRWLGKAKKIVEKEAREAAKLAAVEEKKRALEQKVQAAEQEMRVALTPSPSAQADMDRVQLQNIGFELAGMRRALERMLTQVEELERRLGRRRSPEAQEE